MAKPNRKLPTQSIELGTRTAQFSTMEFPTMELIAEILADAGSILNWRPRSVSMAHEILRRLGGEDMTIEFTMSQFAKAIRPDLAEDPGRKYMSRYVKMLRDDMHTSGFAALRIDIGEKYRSENGDWCCHPTKYGQADFIKLYRFAQDEAIKTNFPDLPRDARRKKLREVVADWLRANGCRPIPRQRHNKPAEVIDLAERKERRVDKRDVEERITAACELLYEAGVDWLNLGLRLPDYVRKIHAGFDAQELRLRDACARHNAPRLKVKGAQPK